MFAMVVFFGLLHYCYYRAFFLIQLFYLMYEKYIPIAFETAKLIEIREQRHVSIVLRHNQIISIGTNAIKTHPEAMKLGYRTPELHSELSAFTSINHKLRNNLILINFRWTKANNLRLSKPCEYCIGWCLTCFDEIWFSNNQGKIQLLEE